MSPHSRPEGLEHPLGAAARSAQGAPVCSDPSLSAAQGRLPQAELAALFEALHAAPHAFDFFALLRRVESLRSDAPRIGRASRTSQEALRLGQEPDLDFAPAALAAFDQAPGAAAPRLGVRFFGLLGSQGPMPLHLTEYVRERLRFRNDATPARFLDIFHHRLLTLFYRAWAQGQPTVQHDRPDDDRFAAWLGATFGLGSEMRTRGSEGPLPSSSTSPDGGRRAAAWGRAPCSLPENARLFQAGLLGSRSRHAEGLTKLLAQYFGVPVRIESCIAHRLPIDAADRSRLGFARNRPQRTRTSSAALGRTATSGNSLHDRHSKFRIALGPLTLDRYLGFLPGGSAWRQLREWVQQYVGLGLLWDVQLALLEHEMPEPRLGRRVPLGVAAWIGRRQRESAAPADGLDRHERRHPADRHDLLLRPATSFLLRHVGERHA